MATASYRDIAALTLTSWWNQVLLDLSGSRTQRLLLVGVSSLLLLGWVTVGLLAVFAAPVHQMPPPELVALVAQQVVALTLLLGPLVLAALLVFSPPRSRLVEMMAALPIPRRVVNLGTELPHIVVATALLGAVLAPILGSSLRLLPGPAAIATAVTATLVGMFGVVLGWAVFRLTAWLGTAALGMPLALSRSAAGFACIALSCVGLAALDLGANSTAPPFVSFMPLLAHSAPQWLALIGYLCAIVMLLLGAAVLTARIPDPSEAATPIVPVWRRVRVGTGTAALVRAEALQWLRNPLVVAAEVLMLVTVLAFVTVVPLDNPAWPLLSTVLLIACTTGSAVFGWGVSRSALWTHTANGSLISRVFWHKVAVSGMISTAVLVLTLGLIWARAPIPTEGLLATLPMSGVGFAAAFAAGVLFPVEQEQSLSSAMALMTAFMITLAIGAGMAQLTVVPAVVRGGLALIVAIGLVVAARIYVANPARRRASLSA